MAEGLYVTREPTGPLRGGVRSMVGFSEHTTGRLARREVAQEVVTVILNLGPPLQVGGRDEPLSPRGSFIAPMNGHFGLTEFSGESTGIQIDLSPACAHRILGVPMGELKSVVVPFDDVAGRWGTRLIDRLGSEPDWRRRLERLERELGRRLAAAPPPSPDVDHAWLCLLRSGGLQRAREIARELGCSDRHLSRRFHEEIGLGPKASGRVIRFRNAVQRLTTWPERYADIAAACGFSDQPHMNREFRELAGCAPGELLAAKLEDLPGFAPET
jgi:AraC-like DNA-binding protein